nr:PREDICTED: uncharacterized protein LOC109036550 [Bemisia tabaci]
MSSLSFFERYSPPAPEAAAPGAYSGVCAPSLFGSAKFVSCYGLLGLFIATLDIVRILHGGPYLPEKLWGRVRKSHAVHPRLERDLKLMVSVIEVEHYTLMILGALNANPVLLLPWLLLQFLVIMFQCLFYLARLFINGVFVNKSEVLTTAFMVHNWLHVFCLFQKQIADDAS